MIDPSNIDFDMINSSQKTNFRITPLLVTLGVICLSIGIYTYIIKANPSGSKESL